MKRAIYITCLLCTTVAPDAAGADPPKIDVEYDPETFVSTITIRAEDGRVAWRDVLRGLARARGNDDTALEGMLPNGSFDVTTARGRLLRIGLNLALEPHVRFAVQRDDRHGGESSLVIRVDRATLLASKRQLQERLRNAFLKRRSGDGRNKFGLVWDSEWEGTPTDRPLIVFVHGLNSRSDEMARLAKLVRDDGFVTGSFRYPNDQPIDESAASLARHLSQLAEEDSRRRVALVTHSMGGLVARAVIEDPGQDPGNAERLIMVAPPNHGSTLAHFAFGLDVLEHVISDARKQRETGLFYAAIEDGFSEAAADLRPGSPFLSKLNARDRNPKVRYTIFLGTGAPLSELELGLLRSQMGRASEKNRWVRFFGSRVETWLADMDEVVRGKGDGVVSVARGRLEGVEDTVLLDFRHIGVLDEADRPEVEQLRQEILKRLKKTP